MIVSLKSTGLLKSSVPYTDSPTSLTSQQQEWEKNEWQKQPNNLLNLVGLGLGFKNQNEFTKKLKAPKQLYENNYVPQAHYICTYIGE